MHFQAPWTPIAADLQQHMLMILCRLYDSVVDIRSRIRIRVVYLFIPFHLSTDRQGESNLLKPALSTPLYITNTEGSVFIEETTFELGFIG